MYSTPLWCDASDIPLASATPPLVPVLATIVADALIEDTLNQRWGRESNVGEEEAIKGQRGGNNTREGKAHEVKIHPPTVVSENEG